ncbi:PA2169 family four-helix-bundle protein [Pseudomonas aeruginosa]
MGGPGPPAGPHPRPPRRSRGPRGPPPRDCAAAADELERIVLELGGKPKDSTSFAGDLHRRWVDLKSLVTGKDEEAVLNECERGEDVAKQRYQAALEKPLPAEIHQVIERQYQGVLRHHDRVRALRDARA